jgi:hypothetical protein
VRPLPDVADPIRAIIPADLDAPAGSVDSVWLDGRRVFCR